MLGLSKLRSARPPVVGLIPASARWWVATANRRRVGHPTALQHQVRRITASPLGVRHAFTTAAHHARRKTSCATARTPALGEMLNRPATHPVITTPPTGTRYGTRSRTPGAPRQGR